ncbi:ATP-dependent DNA helicase, partial [Labrenzia sp. DG1229]|uniref:ATP-dependent DNA helicase n=1 Tax=Labrenzia sp. DG1229 TaxID=681847 RepID=UPI0005626D99
QSIYRFRGASSANMVKFSEDYDEPVIDNLEINYRSSEQIVDSFVATAPRMGASHGMLPLSLYANNGPGPTATEIRRFEKPDDEIEGIAARIEDLKGSGITYRDQAVLCRTNKRLNEIAAGLEARGIPVLHLGSLFEREEIRDLLALLNLAIDPFGDAMVRVGALPRYALTLQDVYQIAKTIRDDQISTLESLAVLQADVVLSVAGRTGLAQLVEDLTDLKNTSTAWEFLASYLLDKTNHARDIATSMTISGQMKGVAIWQFLNFLRDEVPIKDGLPIERTLARIRQMVLLAEERDLRQVPDAALHMNAVRLMTVHGSKGLEFEAVHIPGLTVASFPSSNRGQRCPPPDGMVEGSEILSAKEFAKRAHATEEECLFFVAISRAQKYLNLYLPKKQPNGNNRSESQFLSWLPRHLVNQIDNPDQLSGPSITDDPNMINISWSDTWRMTESRLTAYERCPRRFFYTHVMGLGSARKMTAFSKTHDCIYDLMRWLKVERLSGAPSLTAAESEFDMIWQQRGPVGHAYATAYRQLASRFIRNLLAAGDGREFLEAKRLPVELSSGTVFVEPSEISRQQDGTVSVRRVRTGYCRSDEYSRLEYALYKLAAEAEFGADVLVEALHLTDNVSEPIPTTDRVISNRATSSVKMLDRIVAGQFPPDTDPISCPRCPHFFICAATPGGPLNQS